MKSTFLFLLMMVLLSLGYVWAQEDVQKRLQTQLILVEDGGTVTLPKGTFSMLGTLSMDAKKNITIKGAGMEESVLSFKKQRDGAEGLKITNCENITLEGFSVLDAKGDAIKVQATQGITFRDVKTEWTRKPSKKNGAYGFYPVSSENVLIEDCVAIGASDAGIYVGQSHNIVVRRSVAHHNVAGIEIENSTMADVYECEAYDNTGGILVFDLPNLPKKKGGNVRVYQNKVWENNYKNFATKGTPVSGVPPGTGLMVLAASEVEIFDNDIQNNRTTNLAIVSYHMTENPITDSLYDPYPAAIYVHDNRFQRERRRPTFRNKIGLLLFSKFKKDVPDILYDGILDPDRLDADGNILEAHRICIRDNGDADFVMLDAANKFENLSTDISPYDCAREALAPAKMSSLK